MMDPAEAERIARVAAAKGKAGGARDDRLFSPITAADLLGMNIEPRKTMLSPWLPEAGAAMIHAPRGIGKTHVALAVAAAVASGTSLWRWNASVPRPVLYVDGEMPLVSLQERLRGILKRIPANPPANAYFRLLPADHFRDGLPDLASAAGKELLERLAQGTALVVLDNLSSLARGRENEADDWQPMQDLVLSLRRRGTSTLIVHHAGKSGQQRGTSRREDALDTVIALRRPDDYRAEQGARFEVHFEKARGFMGADAAPFEARLEITSEGYCWTIDDAKADLKAMALGRLAAGEKADAIAKALGVGRATVYRWLKESQ